MLGPVMLGWPHGAQAELDPGAGGGFESRSAPCSQCDRPRGTFRLSLLPSLEPLSQGDEVPGGIK